MTFNLIQLLPDVLDRLIRVIQVSLLVVATGSKTVVFVEILDVVVRVSAEEHSIYLGVGSRPSGPHLPERVAHRIRNKTVLRSLEDLVHANIWWLRIGALRSVIILCWEQPKVFPPDLPPEGSGYTTGLKWLAIHHAVNEVLVLHNDSQFAIMISKLRLVGLVTAR